MGYHCQAALDRRVEYANSKVKKVKSHLQQKLHNAMGIPASTDENSDEYSMLIRNIIPKIKSSPGCEQAKLLTLLPDSWSRAEVAQRCGVLERLVKEAREVKKDLVYCQI